MWSTLPQLMLDHTAGMAGTATSHPRRATTLRRSHTFRQIRYPTHKPIRADKQDRVERATRLTILRLITSNHMLLSLHRRLRDMPWSGMTHDHWVWGRRLRRARMDMDRVPAQSRGRQVCGRRR